MMSVRATPQEGQRRMTICRQCPEIRTHRVPVTRAIIEQCSVCKCFLDLKTKLENQHCPLGKW
jgi:hypothetical protein